MEVFLLTATTSGWREIPASSAFCCVGFFTRRLSGIVTFLVAGSSLVDLYTLWRWHFWWAGFAHPGQHDRGVMAHTLDPRPFQPAIALLNLKLKALAISNHWTLQILNNSNLPCLAPLKLKLTVLAILNCINNIRWCCHVLEVQYLPVIVLRKTLHKKSKPSLPVRCRAVSCPNNKEISHRYRA